ncbi:beta-lactamase family protein [Loktanella sp. TSTF-M6]|uniref:Beta-lactamase family protein n=1 Tax=Loktanella gaetbuli TaxID=2881335 RepID=A0ABS8BTA5_9RHOB|nr:serine hydrolase [Loktanella gaetbuli]MCB5198960.1 beta-lactamase family protein [Loktanella gaetbuli]
MTLTRRTLIAGAAALTALPLRAQTQPWQAVLDRAASYDQLHAMAIHQEGRQVLSQAFRGPAVGRIVPIKSVSKTIVAALTGAALDRGEIASLDATLADIAPGLIPTGAADGVGQITVGNLVTMQAGLERTSGGNYGGWIASRDWVADALQRPFVATPGSSMQYSTGSFHILGAVLSQVSEQSLLTLAQRRLGDPLGIEVPAWTRDPQGRYLGGNEMGLTLPAMVRFGEMYRIGGTWNGNQVLSTDWVDRSFQPRTRSQFSGLAYGYGWFLGESGGDRYALARGYGGQIICVVPSLNLTVAITSDPMRPARSDGYFGDLMRLLDQDILPAARAAA